MVLIEVLGLLFAFDLFDEFVDLVVDEDLLDVVLDKLVIHLYMPPNIEANFNR
jgi:hypothetical protein